MTAASERLPISAIVGSHNEAELLARCLPTIRFCDEIIVIDIDSSDATAEVAAANGARVIRHPHVEIAERARMHLAGEARHDWLLFTDPDEELPSALGRRIADLLPELPEDVGLVYAPIRFYFGRRALQGTIWGGENYRKLLVRRDAVELTGNVYGGTRVNPDFRELTLPYSDDTAIAHRWVSGYRDLLGKHRRYLRLEGPDRASTGELMGWRAVLRTPLRSFRECFVTKKGYLDGPTGLALSVFWAGYSTAANLALLRRLRAGA